jgi:xylulokinase
LMGVMLSAAGSLQWYRDRFACDSSFEELVNEAAQVPAGSEGLIFLPYLSGERTPHPDPLARGAWIGLTTRHSRAHLTRAILEGVAFGLKDIFCLMREAGLGVIEQIRISGGGAKSSLWRQILADVLGAELVTVNTTEGAALGAALLAGVGAGIWPDADTACAQTVSVKERVSPNPETAEIYQSLHYLYQNLYFALKPTFHTLANIQGRPTNFA